MLVKVKREVEEPTGVTASELVECQRRANYYQALHARAVAQLERLKERIKELEAEIRHQRRELTKSASVIDALKAKLQQYVGMLFGRKTEKSESSEPSDPSEDDGEGQKKGKPRKKRGKKKGERGHGRRKREELPTEEISHVLPEDERCCPRCGMPYEELPCTEDSEEIDVQIIVRRLLHKRVKYKRTCSCENLPVLVTAPGPLKLIPKGLLTIGFWVYIILEKFLLQRPLSRVLAQLALYGLVDPREDGKPGISQGTLTGGLKRISVLFLPLYQRILAETRGAHHWHMDETRWLVFVEIEGKKGYRWWLWVVVTQTTVCYLLDPSRSSEVPRGLLEGAEGILSVDRYSAYKSFAADEEGILLAFCWTHVRRDYKKLLDTHRKPALREWAQVWIDRIGLIFKLNRERLEVLEDAEAFAQRDRALRVAVDECKTQAEGELAAGGLHEAQEKALTSMLNHWAGLVVFVDHPEVPMDNSEAERQLREAALGRKNYYGSGSEWSGQMTAHLLSILRTAQRNGVNPGHFMEVYLEACAKNGGKPPPDIDDFLPWNPSAEVREAIERKAQRQRAEVPP